MVSSFVFCFRSAWAPRGPGTSGVGPANAGGWCSRVRQDLGLFGRRLHQTGEASQSRQESLGAQNPPAKCIAKRRWGRIGQSALHESGARLSCISTSGQQMPAMSDDGLLESVDQSASVRIIADDLLAGIPPRHHMIDRAFDPQSSWHLGRLEVRKPTAKRKTKNKG